MPGKLHTQPRQEKTHAVTAGQVMPRGRVFLISKQAHEAGDCITLFWSQEAMWAVMGVPRRGLGWD